MNIGGIKGRKIIRKNKYGVSLELDPFDYIDSFVLKQGFYESEVFEAILDALPRDGIFWDVDSNAGHHAISIKVKRPLSQVVAFEPSSREIARIVRSANLNSANINILPFVLDNKNVLQDFFICQNNSGRNSLERWSDHNAYISSLTQSLTGNEVVDYGYPCPNVIKIDVEGTEERVLIGMKKVLQSPECTCVIFEAGLDVLEENPSIYQLLKSHDFEISILKRNENTSHNLENFVASKA